MDENKSPIFDYWESLESSKFKLLCQSAGGCGCKIPSDELKEIIELSGIDRVVDTNVLIGNTGMDDCSVVDIGNDLVLLSTTDFFSPIVNCGYYFGRISAVNGISDIYAMGVSPVSALAIFAFPTDKLSKETAGAILNGARDACVDAGISISGGHSIRHSEPLFGLAVNGIAKKSKYIRNNTPEIGDNLVITKRIGNGVIMAQYRNDPKVLTKEAFNHTFDSMVTLNSIGAKLQELEGINALTDVTGFGLIGHVGELVGERRGADIYVDTVKLFATVEECLVAGIITRGLKTNLAKAQTISDIDPENKKELALVDPQTSGGLLISCTDIVLPLLIDKLKLQNCDFSVIGKVRDRGEGEKVVQLIR